jgi:hypothetical protein
MLPTSKRVFQCYASHGKGYGVASVIRPWPCKVRILAINAARETRWEDGVYEDLHRWNCPALKGQKEWRRLGWAMPDGSLPFGELDTVDPELAQFDYLPPANSGVLTWAGPDEFLRMQSALSVLGAGRAIGRRRRRLARPGCIRANWRYLIGS